MARNNEENPRRFKNLISTATLAKDLMKRGGSEFCEEAIYKLLDKYGVQVKTRRGGKAFFNRKNARDCIWRHMKELFEIDDEIKRRKESKARQPVVDNATGDNEEEVGYGRDDMSTVSRQLLAKDGVFGADENELYSEGFSFENIVKEILRG